MEKTKSFRELTVWQKSHELVLEVYKISTDFPKHELYGLTSQIRRCSVSIPANIAEGYKKRGKQDKVRFLNIAQGSLEELRYYLILAEDLNYIQQHNLESKCEAVSKMLDGYIKAILASVS